MDDLEIDKVILSQATKNWRKMAMIIGLTQNKTGLDDNNCDAERIAKRIYYLVQSGQLESQGEITNWRFSEVKLASP
ncbi:DUF3658 domain-containing protein [Microbulbifer sp. CNSA002]|uniref:DUF3658 domain-containing protein n=1 Tax=unclassified Microbulbifer TaxID=2619833 RepID=UPI0039B50740